MGNVWDDGLVKREYGKPIPVVVNPDECILHGCTKPPSHRNYCDKHYRQLLRAGELTPYRPSESKPVLICIKCHQKPQLYRQLCISCYHRQYKQDHPEASAAARERYKNDEAFRQRVLKRTAIWQRENRDRINERQRKRRKAKREAQKAQ